MVLFMFHISLLTTAWIKVRKCETRKGKQNYPFLDVLLPWLLSSESFSAGGSVSSRWSVHFSARQTICVKAAALSYFFISSQENKRAAGSAPSASFPYLSSLRNRSSVHNGFSRHVQCWGLRVGTAVSAEFWGSIAFMKAGGGDVCVPGRWLASNRHKSEWT